MSDSVARWSATHALVAVMIETAVAVLRTEIDQLRRDMQDLTGGTADDLGGLINRITDLETNRDRLWAASNVSVRSPVTFVFAGTPVQDSHINVPIVGRTAGVLTIPGTATTPSSTTLGTSRYYNATNPLVASVFTLTRITAAGSTSTIGTVNKPAGTGAATFSGSGAVNVTHGDTLRMTATTVGGSLTNVAISIDATKLY